jgi:hypothetical protein
MFSSSQIRLFYMWSFLVLPATLKNFNSAVSVPPPRVCHIPKFVSLSYVCICAHIHTSIFIYIDIYCESISEDFISNPVIVAHREEICNDLCAEIRMNEYTHYLLY